MDQSKKRKRSEFEDSSADLGYQAKRLKREPYQQKLDLIEHLELQLREVAPEKKKVPKTKAIKKIVVRRNNSFEVRQLVILLKFGSFENFTHHYMSYREISQVTNIRESTLSMIIKRFKDNGYQINKKTRKGRPTKLSEETQAFLKDRETLIKWAPYSLRERCRLLRFQRDVNISRTNLRKFYIRNKIKYFNISHYKLAKKTEAERLNRLCYEYAVAITQAKLSGKDIIYIDQTTFNIWMSRRKTWQPSTDHLECYQKGTRGSGLTLYGAITEKKGNFHYAIYDTTNKVNFEAFIQLMIEEKAEFNGSVLVLDNHSSHKSKESQELINELGCQILFLPPYNSQLNPIETMWALIKAEWRKRIISEAGEIEDDEPEKFLNQICEYSFTYNVRRMIVKVNHLLLRLLRN